MSTWAIITGAGSGIGRALSVELARNYGLHILAVGRHLTTLQETQKFSPEFIEPLVADVSKDEDRAKIARRMSGEEIRFVVHNAAVLQPVKPLKDVSLTEWRTHFAINVEGPLFLTQQLLPLLKTGSRILHVSSGAAHHAYAGWGAYCTSKAALYMIYQVLNLELHEQGILVGSVRPGVVDTPMQDRVRQASREVFPALDRFIQLRKEGKLFAPERVAKFIGKLLTATTDETFVSREWDIREHENFFDSET